jgi:hypothetical protein
MGFFVMTARPMRLADMQEVDAGWHCGSCNKTVVNLADATEAQVAQKLARGSLCGRARTTNRGRLLLAGAAAMSLSGAAHADGNIPVPTVPESDDTTEVCDGSAATGDSETAGKGGSETPSDGEDVHGESNGEPAEDLRSLDSEWISFGIISFDSDPEPWGPQQTPEQARADRLAKRADRKTRRAEQVRAEADRLATDK